MPGLKSETIQPYRNESLNRMADEEELNVAAPGMEDQEDVLAALDTFQDEERTADPLAKLLKHHPECNVDYAETVAPKISLIASPPLDKDPNHRSPPFLTQYEKTKILGLRANQLSQGARPYISVPEYVTDVYEIARLELQQRRLPFIIRRPMPNGSHEYWRLSDLLIV
jgi:DNA-directed RNA polymerase I, II, and III subunit RPABC2